MASISVLRCFDPLVVTASGNSAVFSSLNKVTFLTSTNIFLLFFSIKKSNLVSLLKKMRAEVADFQPLSLDYLIGHDKQFYLQNEY